MSDAEGPAAGATRPLEIPRAHCEAMIAHCRAESPLECCGLLGGRSPRVSAFFALPNVAAQGETRYEADPIAVIEAARTLREEGKEILAIYHSHPRWQAIPSRTDLELNYWGEMPRIIVSLLSEPPEIRAWRLDPESFEELPWTLIESDG
ncbi:CysO-cysteine peptidase [Aquisphaera giovannonii]|uniref:CysO-cysteine peptidase n=1 Tax=Aquisphaera giovannonii TaxID=406548 RepID=A0A5B9WBJ5_9BACT|nr:M67 family metallopeptidase [Aquisphaera giovannonii]QEH37942.1 CysO-cysteine peptidase [Aquisphaera giovannonii]